jgi:hypothetical protein
VGFASCEVCTTFPSTADQTSKIGKDLRFCYKINEPSVIEFDPAKVGTSGRLLYFQNYRT